MSLKDALITGVAGQDGSYLAEHLLSLGYRVHGLYRKSGTGHLPNLVNVLGNPRFQLHRGDVTDAGSVRYVLDVVAPDEVYHLADQDSVAWSRSAVGYQVDVTARSAATLLESVREVRPDARVLLACSATVFGCTPPPQQEGSALDPLSPYACAKAHVLHLARYHRKVHGLHVSTAILFPHTSVRQGPDYLLHKVCRAAVDIVKGRREWFDDPDPYQEVDLGFAGDHVRAEQMILGLPEPDDFCVGTGQGTTVCGLFRLAYRAAGGLREDWESLVNVVPTKGECSRQTWLANAAKLYAKTGWTPSVTTKQLVKSVVDKYLKELS